MLCICLATSIVSYSLTYFVTTKQSGLRQLWQERITRSWGWSVCFPSIPTVFNGRQDFWNENTNKSS